MFLTKNRLRKPRKTIEDDEMLYYLKFSHFDDDVIGKDFMHDKATQFPEMMNKSTQTKGKETSDKGVDTYDELNKIVGDYILKGNHKNINKNEKMVQVNAYKIDSLPSSGSERDDADREGFISRNARRGFRLAEVALKTAITTTNISMAVADTIADLVFASQAEVEQHQQEQQEEQEEQQEQQEQQEVISVHSSPPQTINSSPPQTINSSPPPETINSSSSSGSDDISRDRSRSRDDDSSGRSSENIGHGLLQRDASRSRSITPSTPASSAKTTPRKNSK